MLNSQEVRTIQEHGTQVQGENIYYVRSQDGSSWELTERGIEFYTTALQHYGLEWPLNPVMSEQELAQLDQALLRCRTLELAEILEFELKTYRLPAHVRDAAHAVLHEDTQGVSAALRRLTNAARSGHNVIGVGFHRRSK
jgi:hypothetical protein